MAPSFGKEDFQYDLLEIFFSFVLSIFCKMCYTHSILFAKKNPAEGRRAKEEPINGRFPQKEEPINSRFLQKGADVSMMEKMNENAGCEAG